MAVRSAASFSARASSLKARISAASHAAFLAPFRATVATGMPLGICTVASRASMPSMAPPFMGMPITGRVVLAAKAPARCAAMPAAHRITPKPLARALLANSAASAGVRCAERMCASKGMSSAFSWAHAPFTTGQSLSEPMITATLRTISKPLFLNRQTKKAAVHPYHGL